MWRISQWRSIQGYTWHVDRTPPPPGGTPQPPRGDTLMFLFITTAAAKNRGKKTFTTIPHSPAHWSIVYFVKRGVVFWLQNTLKAACSFDSFQFEVIQSSQVEKCIVTTPETRLDTPETTFLHPTTTPSSTTGVSVSSSFPSWQHHQPKIMVYKVRFGIWNFVVP